MEKQTKNLGHVTAYGYAKSQGYEGTEAEYAELMASYATVAERAEAAADAAAESAQEVHDVIPEVTSADNGKVMMVENGEWGAGEVDVLPTVTAQDNGKVLGVVEGAWAPAEPEDGLPSVTSSDNGKVLSVVEGEWAPAEPTGGLPEVTSEDNGDLLSVVDGAWAKSEPGYRAAMVDGTVIIPEQTLEPLTDDTFYGNSINDFNSDLIRDWFDNDSKPGTLPVTFNGTKYVVPTTAIETTNARGSKRFYCGEVDGEGVPVFTTYPFIIQFRREVSSEESTETVAAFVPTADSFTIKIAEESRDAIPTEDFKLAVNNSYMETTETEKIAIPEQSITTAVQSGDSYASGSATDFTFPANFYSQALWPTTLHVTFNGAEYDLPKIPDLACGYGALDDNYEPDFTTYPCSISFSEQDGDLYCYVDTEAAGTYTLSATYTEATTAPTEKFKEAVKQSGAPGYDVGTEEVEIAAAQSVTTAAQGPYILGQLTATVPDPLPDSINVTFNGTSYENVPKHAEASLGGIDIYGDIAFSEYPFVIMFAEGNLLLTQAAGTYTIEIFGQGTTVTPDDNFKAAVKASGGQAPLVVHVQFDTVTASADKTYDAILAAYNAGQAVIFKCENYSGTVPAPAGVSEIAAYAIKQDDYDAFNATFTFVVNNAVHTVSVSCDGDYWICYYDHT